MSVKASATPLPDARLEQLKVRVSRAERLWEDRPGDWLHELMGEVLRLQNMSQRVDALVQECENCTGYGDPETVRIFRGMAKRLKEAQDGTCQFCDREVPCTQHPPTHQETEPPVTLTDPAPGGQRVEAVRQVPLQERVERSLTDAKANGVNFKGSLAEDIADSLVEHDPQFSGMNPAALVSFALAWYEREFPTGDCSHLDDMFPASSRTTGPRLRNALVAAGYVKDGRTDWPALCTDLDSLARAEPQHEPGVDLGDVVTQLYDISEQADSGMRGSLVSERMDEQIDKLKQVPAAVAGLNASLAGLVSELRSHRPHVHGPECNHDSRPVEVDIDGHVDDKGIRYIGKAHLQPDGTYHALADVGGRMCRVEVRITERTSDAG